MKKIVALVLAMVLGISMIGCSSNNSVATVNGEGIPLEYYKIYTNWTRLGYESSYGFTSSTWEHQISQNHRKKQLIGIILNHKYFKQWNNQK